MVGSYVVPAVLLAALQATGMAIGPLVALLAVVQVAGLVAGIVCYVQARRRALAPSARRHSSMSGTLWQLAGLVLMIGAFPMFAILFAVFGPPEHDYFLVILLLGLPLVGAGRFCYTRGTRHKLPSAEELLAQDPRPPVLYLRSFDEDAAAAANPVWKAFFSPSAWASDMAGEEDQIAEVMNGIGPFVAMGRPGAKLPELGAARMYVGEAEWQARVEQLIGRACLVVFRMGNTPAFWWEIRTVVRMLPPEKIVFLLPYGTGRYELERFRDEASRFLARPIPDYPAGLLADLIDGVSIGSDFGLGTLQAFLHFERDWTPYLQLLGAAPGTVRRGRKLAAALRAAMEPVARQLGVTVLRE
jgi:hypothetical protein